MRLGSSKGTEPFPSRYLVLGKAKKEEGVSSGNIATAQISAPLAHLGCKRYIPSHADLILRRGDCNRDVLQTPRSPSFIEAGMADMCKRSVVQGDDE